MDQLWIALPPCGSRDLCQYGFPGGKLSVSEAGHSLHAGFLSAQGCHLFRNHPCFVPSALCRMGAGKQAYHEEKNESSGSLA